MCQIKCWAQQLSKWKTAKTKCDLQLKRKEIWMKWVNEHMNNVSYFMSSWISFRLAVSFSWTIETEKIQRKLNWKKVGWVDYVVQMKMVYFFFLFSCLSSTFSVCVCFKCALIDKKIMQTTMKSLFCLFIFSFTTKLNFRPRNEYRNKCKPKSVHWKTHPIHCSRNFNRFVMQKESKLFECDTNERRQRKMSKKMKKWNE